METWPESPRGLAMDGGGVILGEATPIRRGWRAAELTGRKSSLYEDKQSQTLPAKIKKCVITV